MVWSDLWVEKRSIVSPVKFLKHFGRKVAKAPCLGRRSSPEVSSSGRSRPSVAPSDTHVAEAIKDCIEFINSSSSLSRSGYRYHGREEKKFHKIFVLYLAFSKYSMISLFRTNHFVPRNRNGSDEDVKKGLDVKMQNAPPKSVSTSTTTDSSLS
ncbi:hypothetical protein DKX38_013872 [Salix brachista]|uniref:Uncharacterized protein n=1 Tax=Salix brachista TaxID=2182728 RepID=A0A5N5LEF1_9ROSI|nr:hypothetical protein DKX38_013872 [Salix brachista]